VVEKIQFQNIPVKYIPNKECVKFNKYHHLSSLSSQDTRDQDLPYRTPGLCFHGIFQRNEKTLPFLGKSKIGMEVDFGNLLKG